MGKYHQRRNELKTLLESQFRADAQAEGHPDTSGLNELLAIKAEQFVDDFEQLANRHSQGSFWRGVWQSFLGSLLFLLALAVFALLIYGNKQNPFRVLTDELTAPKTDKPLVQPTN